MGVGVCVSEGIGADGIAETTRGFTYWGVFWTRGDYVMRGHRRFCRVCWSLGAMATVYEVKRLEMCENVGQQSDCIRIRSDEGILPNPPAGCWCSITRLTTQLFVADEVRLSGDRLIHWCISRTR